MAPRIGMDAEARATGSGRTLRPAGRGRPSATSTPGLRQRTSRSTLTYETPAQYHNAMETHAIVARWEGDRLEIDTPNQAIVMSRAFYGYYFGIPAENIMIRSPYLGGGFGSKAMPYSPLVLAVAAARKLGRPVKLALGATRCSARSATAAPPASGCVSASTVRRG